jgi:hypothetical protein
MSANVSSERRHLTAEEFALVEQSHFPALCEVPEEELRQLLLLLRERRDRARDIAARQRREMRGKTTPAGANRATDDRGSREKLSVLSSAVQRINKEASRRRKFAARAELVGNAQRALDLRQASFRRNHPRPGKTAGAGMRPIPSTRRPQLTRPMEVGRVSQFVKDAQAHRDARQ